MATETRKILGQVALPATVLTDIYVVPAATQAVVSSVYICNRSAAYSTFRLAIAIAGAANDPSQYLYNDLICPGNETFVATVGLTLGDSDTIRGYAAFGTITMTVFGVEIA